MVGTKTNARLSNAYRRLLSEQQSIVDSLQSINDNLPAQIDLLINCPRLASSPPNSRRRSLRIANETVRQVFLCVCGLVLPLPPARYSLSRTTAPTKAKHPVLN